VPLLSVQVKQWLGTPSQVVQEASGAVEVCLPCGQAGALIPGPHGHGCNTELHENVFQGS
jgi:hypothetical protein